ncbi:RNA polymerase sigma factor, sigma-70 family [Echinicola vietnamensis DSM 17526]|uniref:RNA polymerase sigma factor, sigma-70 family n=2 Tax=Echinicola TaxID=390846 RepID=L0FY70_ECHVK|nr:RNA polymerase sigma factor, sigma-70 family [Echinicola vietnamensis DSM 17526]
MTFFDLLRIIEYRKGKSEPEEMPKTQEKEFERYLKKYEALIIKVARVYSHGAENQKDLIQEIVLQLWRAFPKYSADRGVSTWTYRIALNVSISYLRKESSRRRREEEYSQNQSRQTDNCDPIDDRLKILYRFIHTLNATDKALMLLFLEGCKNKEIAKIMGVTPGVVSTKIYRIKAQLKVYFESIESN